MNSDDELAQRGRAIFERLREASTDPSDDAEESDDTSVGTSLPSTDTIAVATGLGGDPVGDETLAAVAAPAQADGAGGAGASGDDPSLDAGESAPIEPDESVDTAALDAGAGVLDRYTPGRADGEDAPASVQNVDDATTAEPPAGGDGPVAENAASALGDPEPAAAVIATVDASGSGTAAPDASSADATTVADRGADTAVADAVPPDEHPLDPPPVVVEEAEVPQLVAQPASFARPLPRVLAIANQKGGVGKTTTAVNLSAALAELGYRVLVIDLDPQGNATTGLGVNPRNLESSVYDVLMHDVPLEDCIEPTSLRNLFVVPATIDLAGAEIELVPSFSRELKLRKALESVIDDFDFVLIDCPPSLGLITVNGLAAATEVVVPIQCEYYALEGLGQLLRNVNLVQGNLNPKLEVSAIILTMYDARTKLADQVANEVRTHFGTKVCRNIVPRTVRLSEAPSFGQPIIVFDPSSRGAIAYRELAKEVSGGAPQRVG